MKCRDVDIIGYVDGKASKEIIAHVNGCKRCNEEAEELLKFTNLITSQYTEGKKLEEELEGRLQTIEILKMKRLPENIFKKIEDLREKSLLSRLKRVVGKRRKDIERLTEGLVTSSMKALPASPKDITKVKKIKKKKKD